MSDLKDIINTGAEETSENVSPQVEENNETTPVGKPVDETISINKSELEGLLARVKKLEEGGVEKPKRVQEDRAYVRLLDGLIVTGIGRMWTEPKMTELNPEDENRLFGELTTEDEKVHKVDFVHFLEDSERLFGFIKKIDKKDISRDHGSVLSEPQNPYENRLKNISIEPFEIEMVENKTDDSFTLEVAEGERAGQRIEIHNSVINL